MISTLIDLITELFKPTIHKIILKNWKNDAKNLHINLYFKNKILFQAIPSRHFKDKGIKTSDENDMSIFHFFNKNRTTDNLERFKSKISNDKFIEFENKHNFNFLRNVGNNPKTIEKEIYKDLELYSLREYEKENIKIEFIDFKEKK